MLLPPSAYAKILKSLLQSSFPQYILWRADILRNLIQTLEAQQYAAAAQRMLDLAHLRHADLRARTVTVTRAVASRIHHSNLAAVFDLWISALRKVRAERARLESALVRRAPAMFVVETCWDAWLQVYICVCHTYICVCVYI